MHASSLMTRNRRPLRIVMLAAVMVAMVAATGGAADRMVFAEYFTDVF